MKTATLAAVFLLTGTFVYSQEKPAPPPPPHHHHHHPGKGKAPDPRQKMTEHFLQRIPEADREGIRKQLQENPGEGRKIMMQYFKERQKKEFGHLMELRKAYLEAKDEDTKKTAYEALKKHLEEGQKRHFQRSERRIQDMEAQLAVFRKRLDEAKERHEKEMKNKDGFIKKMLERFTDPAKESVIRPPKKPVQEKE